MSQTLKVVFSKWKYALGILGLFLLSAALGGAAAYVTTKIGNRPAGVSLPLGYKLSVVLWLPELAKAYYSKAVPSTFIGKGTFLRAEAAIALAAGRPAEAIEKANAAQQAQQQNEDRGANLAYTAWLRQLLAEAEAKAVMPATV